MTCGKVYIVKVFEREHLERLGTSSEVGKTTSHSIPVARNSVKIDLTVVNSEGLGAAKKVKLRLQGSYDGKVWQTDGLTAASEQVQVGGASPMSRQSVDAIRVNYAYLRVKANLIGGGSAQAIINVNLIFTHQ